MKVCIGRYRVQFCAQMHFVPSHRLKCTRRQQLAALDESMGRENVPPTIVS